MLLALIYLSHSPITVVKFNLLIDYKAFTFRTKKAIKVKIWTSSNICYITFRPFVAFSQSEELNLF